MDWARLTWFPEHGHDKVHQADWSLLGHGVQMRLVKVLGIEDRWQRVDFGGTQVRIDGSLLEDAPSPRFDYGARVQAIPPRTPVVGVIAEIVWHAKQAEPYYFLSINGKPDSSRYWTHELRDAE